MATVVARPSTSAEVTFDYKARRLGDCRGADV